MMEYYSFATIDYLILENLPFHRDSSVLEIGIGGGSTVRFIMGEVKEFCGVDISKESVDYLNLVYKNHQSVRFHVADVCDDSSLGREFDIVYSADTLEHVRRPLGFFRFIARHLSVEGTALVTFPNESDRRHHGVTWFNRKEDLLDVIDHSGLEVKDVYQVEKTFAHRFIEGLLWRLPKSIIGGSPKAFPQSFENTQAFAIMKGGGMKMKLYAAYAGAVTKLASVFPLYRLCDMGASVNDKVLLMHLKRRPR